MSFIHQEVTSHLFFIHINIQKRRPHQLLTIDEALANRQKINNNETYADMTTRLYRNTGRV